MKLLIVEDHSAFRDFLRLWVAEQVRGHVPDVFEAATLSDALRVLREEAIDAVLSDDAFPPHWGAGMGNPSEWGKSSATLRDECLTRAVPFVLLPRHPLGKLLLVRGAIEQVLRFASAHEFAATEQTTVPPHRILNS
jgi:CheY-like chemotaxis protein